MTDIELLYRWCETSLEFPNPLLFREIQGKGLISIVNYLPKDADLAKQEVDRKYAEYLNNKNKPKPAITVKSALKNVQINSDFYKEYNIPFKFDVGEKEVLSGLSENSMGDGRRKNTVIHLLVEENWSDGNLKRKSGDFLCTSKKGNNGNSWSDQNLKIRNQDETMPAVTCKSCLKLLKRYKNEK